MSEPDQQLPEAIISPRPGDPAPDESRRGVDFTHDGVAYRLIDKMILGEQKTVIRRVHDWMWFGFTTSVEDAKKKLDGKFVPVLLVRQGDLL